MTGLGAGVALSVAAHTILAVGIWETLVDTTVGLFLTLLFLRPCKIVWGIIYGTFSYGFKKRSALPTKEWLYDVSMLFSILLFGLYSTLYLSALRLPMRSPLHTWLVLGESDMDIVLTLILKVVEAIWFDGISLPALAADIVDIYRPLCISTFSSRPILFWVCVVPICLTSFVCSWSHCIYTDYTQLLDQDLNIDLGRERALPTRYSWALSRFLVWFANVDVLKPPRCYEPGRLDSLPERQGPRPTILGTTQRQVDQLGLPHSAAHLERLMNEVIEHQFDDIDIPLPGHDMIDINPSFLESGLWAIRRNLEVRTDIDAVGAADISGRCYAGDEEFDGDIFHPRRDGTAIAVLHPDDARSVVEAGWGESHQLAINRWYWRLFFNCVLRTRCPFPEGTVVLYAPRNEDELAVLRDIIIATVWNGTNGDLYPPRVCAYAAPPTQGTA